MKTSLRAIVALVAILCLPNCGPAQEDLSPASVQDLISQVSETELMATTKDLQDFGTRVVGYQGNVNAGSYIFDKLSSIPGLEVAYQGGNVRNVIARLPGSGASPRKVYIVGAHYDSASDTPTAAPGATDNGCGTAIVLELARIMSRYHFKSDLVFAAWNSEEQGFAGSLAYVSAAKQNQEDIGLYVNYDSTGYDPEGRLILDIISNEDSTSIAEMMARLNNDYQLGFTVVHNVHMDCWSDYRSFWGQGYISVSTHSEEHAPGAHTANDTIELVSVRYTKKNGQLGMAVLAELAGFSSAR